MIMLLNIGRSIKLIFKYGITQKGFRVTKDKKVYRAICPMCQQEVIDFDRWTTQAEDVNNDFVVCANNHSIDITRVILRKE